VIFCHHVREVVSDFFFGWAVYRLTAALAFSLRLSHHYESQIRPLLEVLQSRQVLKGKLAKGSGWNTDSGITKKNVRNLVQEVADNLCA
jgi:hypothetical protein